MPGSGVDGGVIKAGVIVISLPPLLLLDITSALITSHPPLSGGAGDCSVILPP